MAFYKPRCAAILTVVFDARTTSPKDNSPPLHIVVTPRECSVLQNGYHEADTWNMEFDARSIPVDPDALAAANVRIFMWDDADGYVGDRLGEISSVLFTPGSSLKQIQQQLDNQFGQFEMIRGIADDDKASIISEDNTVKISGRDYTAILMAYQWDTKNVITTGDPLDVTIQGIADKAAPATSSARFAVVWRSQLPIPITGSAHRQAKQKKGLAQKDGKNAWDIIYDLALQHGFIAYVLGSCVVIDDPATQTADSLGSAPRLVYGKHLDSFDIERKFGKDKVPQIIVRAYNPDTDEQIEVVFPAQSNIIVDGLAVQKNEQEYFPAPRGVVDKAALLRYAMIMFHYKGRGETKYTMKTRCLSIYNPNASHATDTYGVGIPALSTLQNLARPTSTNLLRMKTGAAVGISFDPLDREHIRALTLPERVQHIRALGYSGEIANFAALNIDKLNQYEQPYYLGEIKYDWNIDEGINIELSCYNFASQHRELYFANMPTYTLDTLNADAVSAG